MTSLTLFIATCIELLWNRAGKRCPANPRKCSECCIASDCMDFGSSEGGPV